jgi:hypothetical protein
LFLGDVKDNVADMIAKGRDARGKGNARLAEDQVRAVYARYRDGEYPYDLAREYGVTVPTVLGIAKGHTWKRLRLPALPVHRRKRRWAKRPA